MRIPTFSLQTIDPNSFATKLAEIRRDERALSIRVRSDGAGAVGPFNTVAAEQVDIALRYLDLGLRANAEKMLYQAVELCDDQPRYGSAPRTLACMELHDLQIRNRITAYELFAQRTVNAHDGAVDGYEELASILCLSGRFDEASNALRDAIKRHGEQDLSRFEPLIETMEEIAAEVVAHDEFLAPLISLVAINALTE